MATIYDTAVFVAVCSKTISGLRRYSRDGNRNMLGLMGAHSLVYFACVVLS